MKHHYHYPFSRDLCWPVPLNSLPFVLEEKLSGYALSVTQQAVFKALK